MSDVPESDAIEQSQPVDGEPEPDTPAIADEVPEGDALEQAIEVPDPDEGYDAGDAG